MVWKGKPIPLLEWPSNIDYILFVDENGVPNLNNVESGNKWFTITGLLFDKEQCRLLKDEITNLKLKYWENGIFNKKRVVFHSRDIRKKTGPFNPKLINQEEFNSELQLTLKKLDYKIFSSSINKELHISQYAHPYPVYNFCLEFILERFAMYLCNCNKNGLVVVESRGKKENTVLLNSAVSVLDKGNRFLEKQRFKNIMGVYFNPKRTINNKLSFPHLEAADLIGYEIYNYIKNDNPSVLFTEVEKNLYNYPDFSGYGMKVFP
ncbi:DUF3800 domain-containing protein [Bacillus cereus group sp. BfR-BA-01315]|uniref:DUF3800 domain-containing protein n=1 Tax=Bacillus cereus group sp. BfR-BA-01315 TaxID=2920292 RepID=UPI001F582BD6|nr:DUF3800 domain-containing protein [Bacillus cereus group sp. BfR-BA-01315]